MDWKNNIIESLEGIQELMGKMRRVAVVGIKPDDQASRPAHFVPAYLAEAGLEVVPVPVYYPDVTHILGRKVYRRLVDIPEEIDLVNVFRRSDDVPAHVDDILAKRPRVVWLQSGIRNDEVAERLARAGIKVVQDRCLMVEYRRFQTLRPG